MREERKYRRVPISGFVNLKVKGMKLQFSGPVQLISRKGLGVYTKEEITPGTPVAIELTCFNGTETLDYRFTGSVTGSNRAETGSWKNNEIRVIGIKFDKEIDAIEHSKLYHFLIQNEGKAAGKEACAL